MKNLITLLSLVVLAISFASCSSAPQKVSDSQAYKDSIVGDKHDDVSLNPKDQPYPGRMNGPRKSGLGVA